MVTRPELETGIKFPALEVSGTDGSPTFREDAEDWGYTLAKIEIYCYEHVYILIYIRLGNKYFKFYILVI